MLVGLCVCALLMYFLNTVDVSIEGGKPPYRVLCNGLNLYELLFGKKKDFEIVAPQSH